jgi:hypothetical protein
MNEPTNQEDISPENGKSSLSALPSWMRYMPNPPWKTSANLNLQLVDEERQDAGKGKDKIVEPCDGNMKGNHDRVVKLEESYTDDEDKDFNVDVMTESVSITTKEARGIHSSTKTHGIKTHTDLAPTRKMKRKKISSNPFSTSHIVLTHPPPPLLLEEETPTSTGDEFCTANSKSKKRRRLYTNETEFSNLEDTAALFSFCKFNK